MSRLTRRGLVAALAGSAAAAHARTLKTVGVQLYTVRSVIGKDPLATLRALEKIGYREAEFTATDLDHIWTASRQTALKPVSIHLDTALFTRNQDKLSASLADARKRGF